VAVTVSPMTAEPTIVPRWEWRTFGEPLGTADELLATLRPERSQDSDEVYVLSDQGDASVKIRDDLMDVKHLEQVNDDGLELWHPVMKAAFPLSPEQVAFVVQTLNVAAPALDRPVTTVEELRDAVVRPNPELLAVRVHKSRTHYDIDGCMVEVTSLSSDGSTTRTLAVESPDPGLVTATIRKCGLAGRRNVNVPRGLKALVGFGSRRHAVIDVGTNSVKFYLGEHRADGSVQAVVDRADVTRLGEDLEEAGELTDAAMQRTVDAVAGMVEEARRNAALDIAAVGTAGLRIAPNRQAFVDAVKSRTGITVEVISGEEEGRLAYLAATSALPITGEQLVVFDSGGGSSQFTFGGLGQVDERFSVDVGAVRVAERFGLAEAVGEEVVDAALDAVADDLGRLDERSRPDAVVAIGGTSTNLAAVEHGLEQYDADVVHGTTLDIAEIDRQIELYRTRDAEARRQIAGLQPARAEVILAGACIVRTILTKLGHDSLTVSDRGLRHGVFLERFGSMTLG
jgi:exopolyphosphatase/guanosine-5'-triphosphate,3'-diphosphate pyrophosphatase